jgi:Ca2+-binding EF-hand superfamily protein
MADKYCRSYVDKIFSKFDANGNNVLDRGELKQWLRLEVKNSPFKK